MKIKNVKNEGNRIYKEYHFTMDEVLSGGMQNLINQLDSCIKESHSAGAGSVYWKKWYDFENDQFYLSVTYNFEES